MLVRCFHCHEPIELADDGDLGKVVCPACGGSFSLGGESTVPYAGTTRVACMAISPDGNIMASGSLDSRVPARASS